MATGVTVYKSSDANAPVLTGLPGSLCIVLDAILVDGYGSKAAAGWSQLVSSPISGKRIYRAPTGALRPMLRVHDDAQNLTSLGREARLRGYESESVFDTGVGAFPTVGQAANGIVFRKSASSDSTPRPWICVADTRTVYFFCLSGEFPGYSSFVFGEYYSFKTGTDAYNGIIIGRVTEPGVTASTPLALAAQEVTDVLAAPAAAVAGHFVARSFSEYYQPSVAVGKHGNAAHSATGLVGLYNWPNTYDGRTYLWPVTIHEPYAAPVLRGRLRGFWHILHPVGININDGDTWTGSGDTAGKTFMAIKPTAQGNGMFVMEISDTWETN